MPDLPQLNGAPPAVFSTPTLGRAVSLGELYDQRSGSFLGVQLYSRDQIKDSEISINIKHTKLDLSLSTTHQEKAKLLDINAQLSLEVLGGLVKVEGSASYLNDEKSNVHETAYAMHLKTRLEEKRLPFAEPKLGRDILEVAKKDYIAADRATHFVSSIVYGGSFIVNLVARKSELSEEEKIEGKLKADFDKLKGAISLKGEASVDIKDKFKNMDDKFDLVVHGDVALQKVPINPQDVLDTFPNAASLIREGGGVPISATLQPIPKELYDGSRIVYQIEGDFVNKTLEAFSQLDDLSSRFAVLKNSIKVLQDFVPELATRIGVVAASYSDEHNQLLHKLAQFLRDCQKGKEPDAGTFSFPPDLEGDSTSDEKETDESENHVLNKAKKLWEKHVGLRNSDPDDSSQYPSTLVGLEKELLRFQNFVANIRTVRQSLQPETQPPNAAVEKSFRLSTLDDIWKVLGIQSKISLFIMPPMAGDKSNPDLAVTRYLVLLRKYAAHFLSHTPTSMFYAENPGELERRLPNDKQFSALKAPALFIGGIDASDGKLTWAAPSEPPSDAELVLPLMHEPGHGRVDIPLKVVDATKEFSIQFRAAGELGESEVATVLRFDHDDCIPAILFQMGPQATLGVELPQNQVHMSIAEPHIVKWEYFKATFVQDIQGKQWILYVNGDETARQPFPDGKQLSRTYLSISFPQSDKWWNGHAEGINVFARALSQGEIKAQK